LTGQVTTLIYKAILNACPPYSTLPIPCSTTDLHGLCAPLLLCYCQCHAKTWIPVQEPSVFSGQPRMWNCKSLSCF